MRVIVIQISNRVKVRLRRRRRETRDKGLAMRCQIVLQAAKGRSSRRMGGGLGQGQRTLKTLENKGFRKNPTQK